MTLETRTEVHSTAAKQCQVCGQLTYFHELQRRRCAVGESRFYLWRLIPLHSWAYYEPRDLCPTCVSQGTIDERRRRVRLVALIAGGWGLFELWPYVSGLNPGVLGLVGIVVLGRAVMRRRKRNRKALIIRK